MHPFLLYFPLVLLWVIISVMPTVRLFEHLHIYDAKRILQLCLLLVTAWLVISFKPSQSLWLSTWHRLPTLSHWLIGGVFLAGGIATILANHFRFALIDWGLFALLSVWTLYLAGLFLYTPNLVTRVLLSFIFLSWLFYFIQFSQNFWQVIQTHELQDFRQLFSGFAHPRHMNHWQGILFPFLLLAPFILPKLSSYTKGFILFLAGFDWMIILFSGGRGVVLSLFVSFVLLLIFFPTQRKPLILQLTLVIFLGSAFYLGLNAFLIYWTGTDLNAIFGLTRILENTSTSGRVDIWLSILNEYLTRPFTGIGPMHLAVDSWPKIIVPGAHNIILQWLAEWGPVSTLLLLVLGGYGFLHWLKFVREITQIKPMAPDSWLVIALTAAFVTGHVHALFSNVWGVSLSQTLMTIVIAWMLGIYWQSNPANKTIKKAYQPTSLIVSAVLFSLVVSFIWAIYPELTNHNNWYLESLEATGFEIPLPRFWAQGYFNSQLND